MSAHIITNLALNTFSPGELEQLRVASRSLPELGDSGLAVLPGRPELYLLTRTQEGVTLDLATDEEAARMLGGCGNRWSVKPRL